ncbi:ATP-grasp domain-containing protein [Paraburkholderia sp.]|uniref:ATP-grasp domain-containing protein n=1 Tax=Paraburkholderia sp. TaxID=1926495 RepID=UPI0023888AF9|nr:ATP-grasp domain-containing protein [Paraburkholderia sp.]MDE1181277.1 ATP-grasp domain-containing protein [Paraburkholderia sp.]
MHVFLIFSGTNDRAVMALLRAMTRLGERVAIVARSRHDHILSSAYRKHVLATRENDVLSVPLIEHYVEQAKRTTHAGAVTLVPISEYFNTFLLQNRAAIEAIDGCRVPLVDPATYASVSNKRSAIDYFARFGINYPKALARFDAASVPFVAKPHRNVEGSKVLYPVLVKTAADLTAFEADQNPAHYFYQQFVTGQSFYLLCYFARSGKVYSTSQHNLAQQPGGKSIVYAKTSDFHTHPVSLRTIDALKSAGFHGFAMVEFIVNDRGAFFIEMNPRPWGPLDLCLNHDCGLVEAFVGDWATGDPQTYQTQRLSTSKRAAYLWTGGIVDTWRKRRSVVHQYGSERSLIREVINNMRHDVYLGKDSWRILCKELVK